MIRWRFISALIIQIRQECIIDEPVDLDNLVKGTHVSLNEARRDNIDSGKVLPFEGKGFAKVCDTSLMSIV